MFFRMRADGGIALVPMDRLLSFSISKEIYYNLEY